MSVSKSVTLPVPSLIFIFPDPTILTILSALLSDTTFNLTGKKVSSKLRVEFA
jgi:hypothetical protein